MRCVQHPQLAVRHKLPGRCRELLPKVAVALPPQDEHRAGDGLRPLQLHAARARAPGPSPGHSLETLDEVYERRRQVREVGRPEARHGGAVVVDGPLHPSAPCSCICVAVQLPRLQRLVGVVGEDAADDRGPAGRGHELRQRRQLEDEDVPRLQQLLRRQEPRLEALRVRHVQDGQPLGQAGVPGHRAPSDRGSPVVAAEELELPVWAAEVLPQGLDVVHDLDLRVARDALRLA
mmetsp:Transcript_67476/g.197354  ORF Transcript_67476/g.197354 Transcript_67476/m.197354 type:complete len:234 (-) Transcript_67476:534-1235(-)